MISPKVIWAGTIPSPSEPCPELNSDHQHSPWHIHVEDPSAILYTTHQSRRLPPPYNCEKHTNCHCSANNASLSAYLKIAYVTVQNGPIMTTRPGQPERPPNARSVSRSLSTTNVTQRPAPHRSLSQQFPSSSPTRRTTNEGFVDLTLDGPDGVMGRTIPRSRLNLEIGKGSKAEDVVESPKPTSDLTPTWKPSQPPRGRPLLHFDVPSVSNLSPRAAQERGQNEATIKPMPLPVRPGQHAPPTTAEKVRSAPSNLGRKDARPKPYVLEVPSAAPRYSPNGMRI
jgi:hypothetical protein